MSVYKFFGHFPSSRVIFAIALTISFLVLNGTATHTCLARQWQWECNVNLWIVYKDASGLHPLVTDHSIRKLWRVFVKNFFSSECAVFSSIAVFRLLFSSDIFGYDMVVWCDMRMTQRYAAHFLFTRCDKSLFAKSSF